jgi:hypothetical protein
MAFLGFPLASFGLALPTTVWSFYLERDPAQLTSCVISAKIIDGMPAKVANCTNESIACHVLGWYGVPHDVTWLVCLKAVRYFLSSFC